MGSVGREFSGAGLVGVVLGASAATWIVLIFVAILVLIGIAMIITALWVLQNADGDPQALRPLEVMGSRRFRSADPDERRHQLDEARPDGARSPVPILASTGGSSGSSTSESKPEEKERKQRRVRRYRAGDGPADDVTADNGDGHRDGDGDGDVSDTDSGASDDAAPDRRNRRNRRSDASNDVDDVDHLDEVDDDLDDDLDIDDDLDVVEDDWWLDLDDEHDADEDVADARRGARSGEQTPVPTRRSRSSAKAKTERDASGDESYLDVLANWEPDADTDADWADEPDWTSGSRRPSRRSPNADYVEVDVEVEDLDEIDDLSDDVDDVEDGADLDDFEDDDFDDDDFDDDDFVDIDDDDLDDEDADDAPEYDDAMGLAPADRRRARPGGADRWRRDASGPQRRAHISQDELYDDDFEDEDDDYDDYDDYDDEQDNAMDFDDNDYDDFESTNTAPGSDPFFDEDFDGPWDGAPKPQRSERSQRRPRQGSSGGGRSRRRVPSAGMNTFDPEAMVDRFRQRAAAVRRRPLPPVAGEERQEFIRQAKIDYQDFAMIGDAEVTVEDGVLVLRLDLRAD